MNAIISGTRSKLPGLLKDNLGDLRVETIEALENLHRYAQDLRPRILDDLGLVPALEWMTEELAEQHKIAARAEVIGIELTLSPEVQLLLFRIAQEALNNARRHAEASAVVVELEFESNKIRMTISDNGKGFQLPNRAEELASTGKLGIIGMHERARLAGGILDIQSELGKGTQVIAEIPLPE